MIQNSKELASLKEYVEKYPNGVLTDLVSKKIEDIGNTIFTLESSVAHQINYIKKRGAIRNIRIDWTKDFDIQIDFKVDLKGDANDRFFYWYRFDQFEVRFRVRKFQKDMIFIKKYKEGTSYNNKTPSSKLEFKSIDINAEDGRINLQKRDRKITFYYNGTNLGSLTTDKYGYSYSELSANLDVSLAQNFETSSVVAKYIPVSENELEKRRRKNQSKKDEESYALAKKKGTIQAYQNYIDTTPNGTYVTQAKLTIKNLKKKAKNTAYQKANTGNISQCNSYLRKYPSGKYVNEIRERIAYLEISNVSDVDSFLSRYPNGKYKEYALNKKNRYIAIRKRKELVIKNSDISTWALGDRLCSRFNSSGTIEVVLDQWNEDKSKVKVKIVGGATGSSYKGETIEKNAYLWVDVKDFYKCIGDESVDYKMESPKSYNHNFDVGDKVSYSFTTKSSFFGAFKTTNKYQIIGVINEFSRDKRKAKVKILNNDDYSGTLDGQSVWKGNEIWVYISSWKSY